MLVCTTCLNLSSKSDFLWIAVLVLNCISDWLLIKENITASLMALILIGKLIGLKLILQR